MDSLEDPILRFQSISLSAQAARNSLSKFLGVFSVGIDREIYFPSGEILLCTMLLCGSYINIWYEGFFRCNYDILDQSRRLSTTLIFTQSYLQVNMYCVTYAFTNVSKHIFEVHMRLIRT